VVGGSRVFLNCKIDQIPFVYFSWPIEGDPHRLSFWQPLIDIICKNVSSLKSKYYLGLFIGDLHNMLEMWETWNGIKVSCWERLVEKYVVNILGD